MTAAMFAHNHAAPLLLVLVPLVLFLMHRIGDLLPFLAFFATAVFMIFALDIVTLWVIVVPLGVACGIKMLRGDTRGMG